jgi:hypothetical protein
MISYAPADTRDWNGDSSNHGREQTRLGDQANPLTHQL